MPLFCLRTQSLSAEYSAPFWRMACRAPAQAFLSWGIKTHPCGVLGIAPISPRSSQQQWKCLLSLLQGGAFPQEQEKRRGCRQLPAELLTLTSDSALQCHGGSTTVASSLGSLCPLEGAAPCSIVPGGPEMLELWCFKSPWADPGDKDTGSAVAV